MHAACSVLQTYAVDFGIYIVRAVNVIMQAVLRRLCNGCCRFCTVYFTLYFILDTLLYTLDAVDFLLQTLQHGECMLNTLPCKYTKLTGVSVYVGSTQYIVYSVHILCTVYYLLQTVHFLATPYILHTTYCVVRIHGRQTHYFFFTSQGSPLLTTFHRFLTEYYYFCAACQFLKLRACYTSYT